MSAETDKIREKLEKLLAKAQSAYELGSIAEGDTFSAHASVLALKYSVDIASLGKFETGAGIVEHPGELLGPFARQKALMLQGVCRFYGCSLLVKHTFYEQRGKRTYTRPTKGGYASGSHISIFGRKAMIETALAAYTLYGIQLTAELASHRYVGLDAKHFIAGFSSRLGDRLSAIKAEVVKDTPGTDMVLASAFSQADALLHQLYATKSSSVSYKVDGPAIAGAVAAEGFSIDFHAISDTSEWTTVDDV